MLQNIATKSWWTSALANDTAVFCAVVACGCLLLAIPIMRAWIGAGKSRPGPTKHASPLGDQAGTATIEFTMVFPIVLVLALLLTQVTLLMVGNFFVHYAAYSATRTAITYIPDGGLVGGEERNVIDPSAASPKFDAISRAAIFALVPVSGRLNEADIATDNFVAALGEHFSLAGQTQPPWVANLAADRLRYAKVNTDVTLMYSQVTGNGVDFTAIGGAYQFGPRDPVSVRVEHRLNLAVPYVRGLFSDGEHQTADGLGAYAQVKAQYTLTNEGNDTELPDPPALPRRPQ